MNNVFLIYTIDSAYETEILSVKFSEGEMWEMVAKWKLKYDQKYVSIYVQEWGREGKIRDIDTEGVQWTQ